MTVVTSFGRNRAARLRWAGFDGLLFTGAAARPTYAYVENGSVELRDASDLWGKGVHDTVKHFKDKYGADNLSVITIGQAAGLRLTPNANFFGAGSFQVQASTSSSGMRAAT